MSFNDLPTFIDFGGKNLLVNQVYAGFTKPEQFAYNTPLPPPLGTGGGGSSPGGLNGQVQINASGSFGGIANSALTTLVQNFTATTSGTVPASGGGTTNFARADGTWAVPVSGPAGSSGQVQYNNGGVLGGLTSAQLTADVNLFSSSLSGAVPASGGGSVNVLHADGSWSAPASAPFTQRSATSSSAAQPLSGDVIINLNVTTAITISLPQASTRFGKQLVFVDAGLQTGTHNITITPFSGDTIVNWSTPSSLVMDVNGMTVTLYPFNDGVNTGWFIT